MRANASALLVLLSATLPPAVIAQAPSTTIPSQPPHRVIYLNGAADLEQLRATNLAHYLRAEKILAAANEICRPKPDQTFLARFDADPYCLAMLWKTSFPPKKQLSFRLDDVRYVALVTVAGSPGKVVKIDPPPRK